MEARPGTGTDSDPGSGEESHSERDLAKSLAGAGVGFRLSGPVSQNYAVATASGSF